MKKLLAIFGLVPVLAFSQGQMPLRRAFLQTDLNGNQKNITNLNRLEVNELVSTNLITISTNTEFYGNTLGLVGQATNSSGLTIDNLSLFALPLDEQGITARKVPSSRTVAELSSWEVVDCILTNTATEAFCYEASPIYGPKGVVLLYGVWTNGFNTNNLGYIAAAVGPSLDSLARVGPVFERSTNAADWDSGFVGPGRVYTESGTNYMFYFASTNKVGFEAGYTAIGIAYSTNGTNWVRGPNNPIIEPSYVTAYGTNFVKCYVMSCIKKDGVYYGFYNGTRWLETLPSPTVQEQIVLAYATSILGPWTQYPQNVKIANSNGVNSVVADPTVFPLNEGGWGMSFREWYTGQKSKPAFAYSYDLTNWFGKDVSGNWAVDWASLHPLAVPGTTELYGGGFFDDNGHAMLMDDLTHIYLMRPKKKRDHSIPNLRIRGPGGSTAYWQESASYPTFMGLYTGTNVGGPNNTNYSLLSDGHATIINFSGTNAATDELTFRYGDQVRQKFWPNGGVTIGTTSVGLHYTPTISNSPAGLTVESNVVSWRGQFIGNGAGITNLPGSAMNLPPWITNTNELYLRPNAAITNITGFGALATSLSVGDYGWTFRVSKPIKVTSLGLWHNAGMSNSYTLYLRRTNNCTVLSQVNHFPPSGTLETNRFHYSTLDFPVTLTTNETYEVAMYNPSGGTGPLYAQSLAQFGAEILPGLGTAPSVTCLGFSGWPSNVLGVVSFLYAVGGQSPETANPFVVNPNGLNRNPTSPGSSMTTETFDFRLPIRASLEAAHNGPPYDTGFLFSRRPMRDIVGFLDNYPNPYGETYVRGAVEFMKSNNFLAAGWGTVSLNDYWTTNRDANGVLVPRPDYFTNDLAFLANFCHTNGFRFGAYTSWNTNASNNGIGSPYSYLSNDVFHFVKWGADSLMYDNSFVPGFAYADEVKRSVRLINDASLIYQNRTGNTNRGIELRMGANLGSLADQHWTNNLMTWDCVQGVNAYTVIGDENNSMDRALRKMRGAFSGPWFVRPGHAYDVQAIPPGNPKEFLRSMFNMYAIGPMAMAAGYYTVSNATTLDLFTNATFWAYYDDPSWRAGSPVWSNSLNEVWTRSIGPQGHGSNLVCLVNANTSAQNITITNSFFGQPAATAMVLYDPWRGTNVVITTGSRTYNIPATNAFLFVVSPQTGGSTNGTWTVDQNAGGYQLTNFGGIFMANNKSNVIVGPAEGLILYGINNTNLEDESYAIVLSGSGNYIGGTGAGSVIAGGDQNYVNDPYEFIGAGAANYTEGNGSSIVGGKTNWVQGQESSIVGGKRNTMPASQGFIGGGASNYVNALGGVVLAGYTNNVSGIGGMAIGSGLVVTNEFEVQLGLGVNGVVIGTNGQLTAEGVTVRGTTALTAPGGELVLFGNANTNLDSESYGLVASGEGNTVDGVGAAAFIGGGRDNLVNSPYVFIGAGAGNEADGSAAVIVGGTTNTVHADQGAILGGTLNTISGTRGVIGGGYNNQIIAATDGAILGGLTNDVSAIGGMAIGSGLDVSNQFEVKIGFQGNALIVSSNGNVFGNGASNHFTGDLGVGGTLNATTLNGLLWGTNATSGFITNRGLGVTANLLEGLNAVTSYGSLYAQEDLFVTGIGYINSNVLVGGSLWTTGQVHIGTASLTISNSATETTFIEGGTNVLTLKTNAVTIHVPLYGNGGGLTNLPPTGLALGATNQVLISSGTNNSWTGNPQVTNLTALGGATIWSNAPSTLALTVNGDSTLKGVIVASNSVSRFVASEAGMEFGFATNSTGDLTVSNRQVLVGRRSAVSGDSTTFKVQDRNGTVVFSVSDNGVASFSVDGTISPISDATSSRNLGSATKRWGNGYFTNLNVTGSGVITAGNTITSTNGVSFGAGNTNWLHDSGSSINQVTITNGSVVNRTGALVAGTGACLSGRIAIWNGYNTGAPALSEAGNLTTDFSGNVLGNSWISKTTLTATNGVSFGAGNTNWLTDSGSKINGVAITNGTITGAMSFTTNTYNVTNYVGIVPLAPLVGSASANISAAATNNYVVFLSGASTGGTTDTAYTRWFSPTPVTLNTFLFQTSATPGSGNSYSFFIWTNGVEGPLVATISGASQTSTNSTFSLDVPAGVGVKLFVTNTATSTLRPFWSIGMSTQ